MEHARAMQIPLSFEQAKGNELIETDFTDKELTSLDKMVRETLGKDYEVVYYKQDSLYKDDCSKSYIVYGVIHKELFKRSKAKYDKKLQTFCSADFNRIIIRNKEKSCRYSTCGYIWFTFEKRSNSDIIVYSADDVETFGIKAKYKKHWDKLGHFYLVHEILFNNYLNSAKNGLEKVKKFFEKFL
jgi:hypothetical protein